MIVVSNENQNALLNNYNIEPWQTQLPKFLGFKRKVWLFWLLSGATIFIIQYSIVFISGGTYRAVLPFGIYCFMIAYSGYFHTYLIKKFKNLHFVLMNIIEDKIEIEEWYKGEIKKIFNFKNDLILFLSVGLLTWGILISSTSYFSYPEFWFKNRTADIFGSLAFLIWCFVIVPQLTLNWGIIRFGRSLSKFSLRMSVYQHPLVSIKSIGKLFFTISITHSIGLVLLYLGIFLAPIPFFWSIIIYMILIGIVIFTIFIFSQVGIHKMMVKSKNEKIKTFSAHIEKLFEEVLVNPTNEIIDRLDKLYSVQEKLNNMSVWPFDTKALFTILSTILIPIILVIIEIISR